MMMQLLPSMMDIAALAAGAFSPSKSCRVRVSSTRYRNDPYRACVIRDYLPESFQLDTETFFEVPASPVFDAHPCPTQQLLSPVSKSVMTPAKVHYAVVGFKHDTMMYIAPFRVARGDVVVVEADRGEHIGVVQEITTTTPNYRVPSRILRHASKDEFEAHQAIRAKETAATKSIQRLAGSLGLGIKIIDTEFQFDRNKLTVFFASKIFVDFRKLQRSLYRDFRCRIWLVNWAEVRPYSPAPLNPV